MHTKYPNSIWAVIAALALMALACGLHIDLVSTAVPSPTPSQLPPAIPADVVSPVSPPTNPPEPTVQDTSVPLPAADVETTEAASRVMADVKDYYQRGYLPFENGQLYVLDDFSKTRATNKLYDFTRTGQQSQNFALWADIELNTIGSTTTYPDYTGCGFAYRVQNGSEGYTAILTNTAVRMGSCNSSSGPCTLFGTTNGTGVVDVPNKSKVQFSLAVNKDHAWVLVDGTLVGQYSLYTTRLMGMGDLDYAVVSNINAGYMTSCQITNVRLWESEP